MRLKLLAVASSLLLAGCAGWLETLPQPFDQENATWIISAKRSVLYRAERLDPGSAVVRELANACGRGVMAKVVLPEGPGNKAQLLAGSCVRVYLSGHPGLAGRRAVLLVDGDTVVEFGNMVAVGGKRAMHEYLFWQALVADGVAVN